MPRGRYQSEYFHNPSVAKTDDCIYEDLDRFTNETFADEPEIHQWLEFSVLLPPLSYEGRFIKGLFFSQGVDMLLERFPELRDLFVSVAHSKWSAYPWSRSADAYFVCYDNPARETWFRARHSDRASISLLPLQDADFTHEYIMAPVPVLEKDIDVLCISRLADVKNLPLIALALKIYRRKYADESIHMTLVAGKPNAYAQETLNAVAREELKKIDDVLEHPQEYIDFVDFVPYHGGLVQYYNRAAVFVLGSLFEGKNRCLHEAMSSNTPVVCFKDLNRHARGDRSPIPPGAGLSCEYDAEQLADAIHEILHHGNELKPRARYLESSGRLRSFFTCLKKIEYYRAILKIDEGCPLTAYPWLDLAVQENYGVSLYDFVYGRRSRLSDAVGIASIELVVQHYVERFCL